MKKILSILLICTMIFSLVGCGEKKASVKTYTITYNQNAGNVEGMPNYQFHMGRDLAAILGYEARMNFALTLNLKSDGTYELISDIYSAEAGKRLVVGEGSGVALVLVYKATGTYKDNNDGTVVIEKPNHATYEMNADTYTVEMIEMFGLSADDNLEKGEWDSDTTPALLDVTPATIFTLSNEGAIVKYEMVNPPAEATTTEVPEDATATQAPEATGAPGAAGSTEADSGKTVDETELTILLSIPSNDEGSAFNLCENGVYEFRFDSYDIIDQGTYVYDPATTTFTITDANGVETVSSVDGDNVVFHYLYSQSDQLTGDYTVAISELAKVFE